MSTAGACAGTSATDPSLPLPESGSVRRWPAPAALWLRGWAAVPEDRRGALLLGGGPTTRPAIRPALERREAGAEPELAGVVSPPPEPLANADLVNTGLRSLLRPSAEVVAGAALPEAAVVDDVVVVVVVVEGMAAAAATAAAAADVLLCPAVDACEGAESAAAAAAAAEALASGLVPILVTAVPVATAPSASRLSRCHRVTKGRCKSCI